MPADPHPNKLTLGPLLGVEGDYRYSVCFLIEGKHSKTDIVLSLNYEDGKREVKYEYSEKLRSCYFYRYSFTVPKNKDIYHISYHLTLGKNKLASTHGIKNWTFQVPGSEKHPKVAFMSCNGDSSSDPSSVDHRDKYAMWSRFMDIHNKEYIKFNAMIMSGDQVYADALWKKVPYFRDNGLDKCTDRRFLNHKMTKADEAKFCDQLTEFYEELYIKSWSSDKSLSEALASVPSIMMWDDHDIFDGYGSHKPELQKTKLFKNIFKVAKKYFELLQIRSSKNHALMNIDLSYNSRFTFRTYEFVVLDNRSKRTREVIMEPEQYKEIEASFVSKGLKSRKGALKDQAVLCFVIPVPIGHLNYSKRAESLMKWYRKNRFRKSLNDDGIDHWDHKLHVKEHKVLLDMMMRIGKSQNPKYLLAISGDVHSAGAANVYRNENTINQYISSPMAHKTAGWLQQRIMNWMSSEVTQIADYNITIKNYGATDLRTIYSRNFGYLYKKRGGPLTGYLETEEPLMDGKELKKKLKLFIDKKLVKEQESREIA